MTPRALLADLRAEVHLSSQDRDVLVVCLIGGAGMLAALTGTGWAILGLARLVTIGRKIA